MKPTFASSNRGSGDLSKREGNQDFPQFPTFPPPPPQPSCPLLNQDVLRYEASWHGAEIAGLCEPAHSRQCHFITYGRKNRGTNNATQLSYSTVHLQALYKEGQHHYPHFTDGETEAQNKKVTCPQSPSKARSGSSLVLSKWICLYNEPNQKPGSIP